MRTEAAFNFMFKVGSEHLPVGYPYIRNFISEEFYAVLSVLRQELDAANIPNVDVVAFDGAMLRNIALHGHCRILENRWSPLQLCVERIANIASIFGDKITVQGASVVIIYLLEMLATQTSYGIAIDSFWLRMMEVAQQLSTYRSPRGLTTSELTDLRNKLILRAPHYAYEVQHMITDLETK
jgi:hypothetical protein